MHLPHRSHRVGCHLRHAHRTGALPQHRQTRGRNRQYRLHALKNFIAYFNKLVGGEISVYETLMRRARREATLRLKESARAKGYNALANLRIENCDIGMMTGKGKPVSVAVVACATAYRLRSLE
jgi:uncharacterized protein YbjQ (UPF0145 family)